MATKRPASFIPSTTPTPSKYVRTNDGTKATPTPSISPSITTTTDNTNNSTLITETKQAVLQAVATKRPASSAPSTTPPSTKHLRTNDGTKATPTPSVSPFTPTTTNTIDTSPLITETKQAVLEATSYAHNLSTIIENLIQQVELSNLATSTTTVKLHDRDEEIKHLFEWRDDLASELAAIRLRLEGAENEVASKGTRIVELEEEKARFGSRQGFEKKKMKELKEDQGRKIAELKGKQVALEKASKADVKQKVHELQAKHKDALVAKEKGMKAEADKQEHKLKDRMEGMREAYEEKLEKQKEVLKAKEVVWKDEMAELRASHREQLAKVEANVEMVEAAQKVVQLNADAGKDSEKAVKAE